MGKILSKEESKYTTYFGVYENGDYRYDDDEKIFHLIRDWKDLLAWLEAENCHSYINDDYSYQSKDVYWHLIRNNKDLLKDKWAIWCYSYEDYYYVYQDYKDNFHIFNPQEKEILPEITKKTIRHHKNGIFEYKDEKWFWYFVKDWTVFFNNNKHQLPLNFDVDFENIEKEEDVWNIYEKWKLYFNSGVDLYLKYTHYYNWDLEISIGDLDGEDKFEEKFENVEEIWVDNDYDKAFYINYLDWASKTYKIIPEWFYYTIEEVEKEKTE